MGDRDQPAASPLERWIDNRQRERAQKGDITPQHATQKGAMTPARWRALCEASVAETLESNGAVVNASIGASGLAAVDVNE